MGQNESKNYQKYQQQQQKRMANAQMHFMQHQSASMCQNVNPNNNSIHFVKQGTKLRTLTLILLRLILGSIQFFGQVWIMVK